MKLNNYWKYLKYILEHKKNVFIECWNEKLYIHAFTHDISKLLPSEFFPYAEWFYGSSGSEKEFNKAWELHYKRNKHHPEHWAGRDMPIKYVKQMVCDLKAMSRKFGGSAQQYYIENYHKWNITNQTRYRLELELGLLDDLNAPLNESNEEFYMTLGELIENIERHLKRYGAVTSESVKASSDDLFKLINQKYGLNVYETLKKDS